jgi:hypothetical protein
MGFRITHGRAEARADELALRHASADIVDQPI